MLTVYSRSGGRNCDGLSRRDLLRAGVLGLGGLTLPWLLRTRTLAAAGNPGFVRDKAVVLVFLTGGASHIETFNPNMDAPEPHRSVTGAVRTTVPGITLGGTFPLLARHAGQLAAVHSFKHPVGDHAKAVSHVLTAGTDPTGDAKEGFGLGALYARLRGSNHPATGLPTYAVLTAPHKDGQYAKELDRVVVGSRAGSLGPTAAPFNPAGSGTALANMKLNLPAERLGDRRELLRQLDGLRRRLDATNASGSYDQFAQQAVDLLTGGAGKAFDLSQEPAALVERYDTGMFHCGHKVKEPSVLGKQMLMARRLIEAGAGFVTVQSAGWDMHADGNNPGIKGGMEMLGPPLDKALSAFLEDVEQRGLRDKVLLILTGDFGRTPKINNRGGRDHWANLCTLALFGGGLKTGQVVGRSDRTNSAPATDPVTPAHLLGTVMHTLFDVGTLRVARGLPVSLVRLIEASPPISQLH
jgi:uncharacterized protein (DUF1501 family)